MEVEPGSHPGPPRRQISNISIPYKKSGIAGSSSNLVNSIVGAGIIGVPYALKESGLVAGVLLLVIVSYFTGRLNWTGLTVEGMLRCVWIPSTHRNVFFHSSQCFPIQFSILFISSTYFFRQILTNDRRNGQFSSSTKGTWCFDV